MKFYIVYQHRFDDARYAFGEYVDHNVGDCQRCRTCGAPISMKEWLPPHTVKLSKPSYGDFVHGDFRAFLVSEAVKQKYEALGLQGIARFEKVDVVKVCRRKATSPAPPDYYHVVVQIGSTRIDEERSNVVRRGDIVCTHCMAGGFLVSYGGVFIEEGTWDGLDIFSTLQLPGLLLVSDKFREFVRDNDFSNMGLIPAEEYKESWG